MRHSSWRDYSRSGIRWLGVSALVTGRVFSMLASAGGVSVTGLPVAVLAVELIAVEVALAEKTPYTASSYPSTDSPSTALPANDDRDDSSPGGKPLDRLPPGGWQMNQVMTRRR